MLERRLGLLSKQDICCSEVTLAQCHALVEIGQSLMTNLIRLSEENNFWTLQSAIIRKNATSIELHKKCGFREIGIREKVAKMDNGVWHDTILMERRSKLIGIN